jgi:hypothetical protein
LRLQAISAAKPDNEIIADVPEILPDSEDEDELILEINEFIFWQKMQDDPDDDDDPEEQEEFINSDEFSSSIPIDPNH